MNGAEILLETAIAKGIDICFANAGTTEMPLVVAMDKIKGIKAVLGLFEGVCTGAADGFGRMSGKPAMTLLHLGPGFANGIANLHNARRAHTPLLNIIGEHATWHRSADPPLAMDIEGLGGTLSDWTHTVSDPANLPFDVVNAISFAMGGRIANLIVPHDYQLASCDMVLPEPAESRFDPLDEKEVKEAAKFLRSSRKTAIMLGARALSKDDLLLVAEIQSLTGCDLLVERFFSKNERGPDFQL